MEPKLERIWLNEFKGRKDLRADFSNDRHHAVTIQPPHGTEQLANALIELARNIRRDPNLTANNEVSGGR